MLSVLSLQNTSVSDRGLDHLKPIRGLDVVILDGTQVTAEGKARLKQAIPRLSFQIQDALPNLVRVRFDAGR